MNKLLQSFLTIGLLLISIVGCSSKTPVVVSNVQPSQPLYSFDNHLFGEQPEIVNDDEIFKLSKTQKQQFLDYLRAPTINHIPNYKKVYNYLEHITHAFNYLGETKIATHAMDHEEGNCLSLAILTTALAKLAGVKVGYQLIDSSPVFSTGDESIIKGVHIRTKLYNIRKVRAKGMFYKEGIVVDYFPHGPRRFLGNVSRQEFIARYYRNIAVDYLQQGDLTNSFWHAKHGLQYAPLSAEGISLLAVIHKRKGYLKKAESLYQYGIGNNPADLSLLKNYRLLLREAGRLNEATLLTNQIDQVNDPSPYEWLTLADSAYANEELTEAQRYYKKAIDLAPYLQYGYLGLAKIYFKQGYLERSETMLLAAQERNYDRSSDQLYQAKLAALASIRNR